MYLTYQCVFSALVTYRDEINTRPKHLLDKAQNAQSMVNLSKCSRKNNYVVNNTQYCHIKFRKSEDFSAQFNNFNLNLSKHAKLFIAA